MNENENDTGQNDKGQINCPTFFDCLSPQCGTILATVVADIIAAGLDPIQIVVVASFITSVSSNMFYIAAQMDLNEQMRSRQKEK